MDPCFPEPLMSELDINIFCDSDHGNDQDTGHSITGVIAFVGRTPVRIINFYPGYFLSKDIEFWSSICAWIAILNI